MRPKSTRITTATAILGRYLLISNANAAILFTSTFDNGTSAQNDGGWNRFSSYNYASNFTLAGPAGAGPSYAALISDAPMTTMIDLSSEGADIDAGNVNYDFSGYLGSYTLNTDRGEFSIQFKNAVGTNIGAEIVMDDGAAGNPNGTWTQYTSSGTLAAGVRQVEITFDESRTATFGGTVDGYADLVSFSTTVVPEPSSSALLGLGGLALIIRRRK